MSEELSLLIKISVDVEKTAKMATEIILRQLTPPREQVGRRMGERSTAQAT